MPSDTACSEAAFSGMTESAIAIRLQEAQPGRVVDLKICLLMTVLEAQQLAADSQDEVVPDLLYGRCLIRWGIRRSGRSLIAISGSASHGRWGAGNNETTSFGPSRVDLLFEGGLAFEGWW